MDWRSEVLAERAWRNDLYLGPDSPLGPDARTAFKGLAWWDVDPAYRIAEIRLSRYPVPRSAALATTGADGVAFLEVGTLAFDLQGTPCRLLAFEPAPGEADEPYILIPFKDATSGRETYGAGRYLDLEPREDDLYVLDFNRAYHPYCAYDDAWSCTLPPPENTLPVRVVAGERL